MAEEEAHLLKPAAGSLQNVGGSHPAFLMDAQTQDTGCRDSAVRDDHGKATAPGTDTERQSVDDKVGVSTSPQTPSALESKDEKMLYRSVLQQMQQQQKLKGGRRCKKKTLMKMAKLFVIAKEWNSEIIEPSGLKYSNGHLSEDEPSELNQEEEMKKNTTETESPEVGSSDCDKETFSPAISENTINSGETSASQVTLKEKRRTASTCKKQAKEVCSASTNLLDVPDLNGEVSAHPRLTTAPKVQRKSRKMSSVTFKEDTKITCDDSETSAAISSVVVSKTQTCKRRKKSPTLSVKKKSNKLKLLSQTLTDCNAVTPQDVSEGFLVSAVTQKDENEASCATAAGIHSKDPTGMKSKKKTGRTFGKKALMSKDELFVQEAEITGDTSRAEPPPSQVSSRGKKSKKEVISGASERKSTGKQRSKLKSAETMDVTPESIIKTDDSAGVRPNDEVSFQAGHRDCGVQEVEVKSKHPKTLKKVVKKRISTSKSKCKKEQQAVQLLSTDDISLQKQNETTNISTSQIQKPRKRTANSKKCKAEPVNVPVSVSVCDHSAMNQCATAEFPTQMSDIKTEPACEPVTQPLAKKENTKKSRQRKKPVQRAKNTMTLNAPIKEESDYFDVQVGTFGQEQQLDNETTRRNNPEKPGKGQRKQKKVEDKAGEQTMNPDLNIKCEELALNQLDSPPIHIQKKSGVRRTAPVRTQPCRKKLNRDNTKKPTTLISVCGSGEELPCGDDINNKAEEDVENSGSSVTGKTLDTAHKSLKQTEKKVKLEPDSTCLEKLQRNETKCKKIKQRKVTSASLVNDVMVHEGTTQPEESLISYLKDMKSSQISKCRRRRAVQKEPVVDEAVVKNGHVLDEVLNVQDTFTNPTNENPHDVKITGNQEDVPKEQQLISDRIEATNPENMKKFKGRKKRLVARKRPKVAAAVVENVKVAAEVQSVENDLTSLCLPEHTPENIKGKRKREGPNPADAFLNKNIQEKVKVNGERSKKVKPELCAVEDKKDVKLEPEDNISASFGCQTTESPEMTETGSSEKSVTTCAKKIRRGNQRRRKTRRTKSPAAVTQTEEVVSDSKDVLTVYLEVDCEAPAKKEASVGLSNCKSSEHQPESDTGVLVNQEISNKTKTRRKSAKGKAAARSGEASQAVEVSDADSSIHHTANIDLNVKQEHDESKISEAPSEAPSPIQDKISPAESAVSAGSPTKTTIRKKRRRNKTLWYPKKKKHHQIRAHCDFPSLTDDEMINLELKDENDDVTQRNTVQPLSSSRADEMTADTKVECSSQLKNDDLLHQKLKPQKPIKCSFCGRSFRHISALTVHKRIHSGEKPYSCTTCSKRFAHVSRLNLHKRTHVESPVRCPCCVQKFKSKDELIVHLCVHLKDTKSSNVTEDARSRQVGDCLDSPVTSSHKKPFRCSVCCKEFINRATFKMHGRTHGGKPHACSVCGKSFCKPSSLNAHEKTHWPVKPYSCSVCCAGFVKLQELKRHSELHSGVTPFSCTRCEKAFGSFALLRSHQVSEVCSENQDPTEGEGVHIEGFLVSRGVEGRIITPVFFKCPICKQLHRHWCQHVLHLQTHTQSKSYLCETCGQEYERASDMRSHCGDCCRASGEEKACRSSLSDIWKEPEAPRRQESEPPHEDQKGQMSFSPQVETGELEFTDLQSPPPSPSDSSPSVNDKLDISVPSEFSVAGNNQTTRQPSRFGLKSLIRRHCGRYSRGHFGKSFNRWNKLWLHQRSLRPFCCGHCGLEFRFLGSYKDHLREHAAKMPYTCPLCPDTFPSIENMSSHIFERHKQHDDMKCSTCGRNFSTLRHLKKHKLLHKRASSHFCLPCNISFSRISALKTHLKTHRTRLNVPQPAGRVEPFSFPYSCGKCAAKFSSTDLLQAHQVCHFTMGGNPDSPPESVASCNPSREELSELSQRKQRFPVSNKKHLFRYPHPDRLYVVPVVSSEPAFVISDTEEEQQEIQVQNPSIAAPASDTMPSAFPREQPAPNISNIPQSSAVATLTARDEHETGSSHLQLQDYSHKSAVLQEALHIQDAWKDMSDISDCDSDSAELETPFRTFKENEFVDDVHRCAICMETFRDISKLHEHYIDHAKRV